MRYSGIRVKYLVVIEADLFLLYCRKIPSQLSAQLIDLQSTSSLSVLRHVRSFVHNPEIFGKSLSFSWGPVL